MAVGVAVLVGLCSAGHTPDHDQAVSVAEGGTESSIDVSRMLRQLAGIQDALYGSTAHQSLGTLRELQGYLVHMHMMHPDLL